MVEHSVAAYLKRQPTQMLEFLLQNESCLLPDIVLLIQKILYERKTGCAEK